MYPASRCHCTLVVLLNHGVGTHISWLIINRIVTLKKIDVIYHSIYNNLLKFLVKIFLIISKSLSNHMLLSEKSISCWPRQGYFQIRRFLVQINSFSQFEQIHCANVNPLY